MWVSWSWVNDCINWRWLEVPRSCMHVWSQQKRMFLSQTPGRSEGTTCFWRVNGETWDKDTKLNTSHEDVRREKFTIPIGREATKGLLVTTQQTSRGGLLVTTQQTSRGGLLVTTQQTSRGGLLVTTQQTSRGGLLVTTQQTSRGGLLVTTQQTSMSEIQQKKTGRKFKVFVSLWFVASLCLANMTNSASKLFLSPGDYLWIVVVNKPLGS